MKSGFLNQLSIATFLLIFLYSCGKEHDSNYNPPGLDFDGSVEYKVNGGLVKIDNWGYQFGQYAVIHKQVIPAAYTQYQLDAGKLDNNINLNIVIDSLQEINYHIDSIFVARNSVLFGVLFHSQHSGIIYNGDYLDLTIESYKNGRISGTFSGKLTPEVDYTQKSTIMITEGKLNDVIVIY